MSTNSLFLSHPDCLEHGGLDHPENRRRLEEIFKEFGSLLDLSVTRLATQEELLLVHTHDYLNHVFSLQGKTGSIDYETPLTQGSVQAALRTAGLGLHVLDQILAGHAQNGFILGRPPGHHARPSAGMGFCLFNTIALIARKALDQGLKRILILDWDVHHGNGTQETFYNDDRVYFVDLHQENLFPKDSGTTEEKGVGKGLGWTLNIPLQHSCVDADYLEVLKTVVQPHVYRYRPELILVSAGFDADISDQLGSMSLTSAGYRQMTQTVKQWAEELCDGRLILNLEGGYDPVALAKNGLQCAEVLASPTREAPVSLGEVREDLKQWILRATRGLPHDH
jgi:acetoin utilization deacetylase AcuC-like enzyme